MIRSEFHRFSDLALELSSCRLADDVLKVHDLVKETRPSDVREVSLRSRAANFKFHVTISYRQSAYVMP